MDACAAANDDRGPGNTGIAPADLSFLLSHTVDVTPDAANGPNAVVIGVALLRPRADAEIDVRPSAFGKRSKLIVFGDEVCRAQPQRRVDHATLLLTLGRPALDEPKFDQLIGSKQRREELLQLLTDFSA